jgi:DNA polymerase III subunit epsilon
MKRLDEIDVLCIDCQTTGASPALGAVLELGWAVARAGDVPRAAVSREVALPEGARIPRIVSQLTGIRRSGAAGGAAAVTPEEAWEMLRAAAATVGPPAPSVIHYARFELAFLSDLAMRYEPGGVLPLDVVCAHDIAKRLFPDLPRRGLRALAGYFGHRVELLRRSAEHAEATACVWRHLVRELGDRGITEWPELKAWIAGTRAPTSHRRAFPLPRERRLGLPAAPGVYRFLRSNGDVLYVGKARRLRQRVSGHFTQGRTSERALEMLTQVRDIDITETASALEAALLEADEIKRHDPPYNVQLTPDRAAWFVSPDLGRASEVPGDARWLGPLPSRFALSSYAAVRALVLGAAPTPELYARACGVPPAFGPDAAAFSSGLTSFVDRYVAPVRSRTEWGRFVKVSKILHRLLGEGVLEEGGADDPGARWWDPDRIRRRLERGILSGGQLIRRARWLCLACDASIAFREVDGRGWRELTFDSGALVEARDLSSPDQLAPPRYTPRSRLERMQSFDGARYDRLRVVTTELKRVLAESGDVWVSLPGRPVLQPPAVRRLLGSV